MTVYYIEPANYYIDVIFYDSDNPLYEPWIDDDGDAYPTGYYWAWTMPGCLPDGFYRGPWETAEECLSEAMDECQDGV